MGVSSDYADCFVREGDYANAESLLHQSRAIAGEIYSQDNPFWQEAKALRFSIDTRFGESSKFRLIDGELKEHDALAQLKTNQDYPAIKKLDEVYRDYQSIFSENDPRIGEAQVQLSIALMTSNGKSDLPLKAFDYLKPIAEGFLESVNSRTVQDIPTGFHSEKVFAEYIANTFMTLACVLGGIGEKTKAMEAVSIAGRLTMEPRFDYQPKEAVPRLLRLSQYAQWLGEYGYSERLISYSKKLCEKEKSRELLFDCFFAKAHLELLIGKFDVSYKTAERGLFEGMSEISKDPKRLLDYYQLLAATAHASKRRVEAVRWSRVALDCEGISDAQKVESLTLLLSAEFDKGSSEGSKRDGLEKLKQLISTRIEGLSPNTFGRAEEVIAMNYLQSGDLAESRRRFGRALRWIEKDNTQDGYLMKARCLGSLAMLEERTNVEKWTKKDELLAQKYALQASQILQEFVSNSLPSLSFPEQCAFLGTLERQKDVLLNVCRDEESIEGAYGYLLSWKGLLIETLRRDALINSAAASASGSARKYIDNQRRIMHDIAQLSAVGRTSSASTETPISSLLNELSIKKRHNELEIAKELGVSIQDPLAGMGPDAFARLLGPDEIFMDTMQFRSMLDNKLHYAAVVSRPAKPPFMVDLGSSEDIDKLIRFWRFSVTGDPNELSEEDKKIDANFADGRQGFTQASSGCTKDRDVYRVRNNVKVSSEVVVQRTRELASLLFDDQKMTEIIGQTKRIWFCPEGNLARIPWMAIAEMSDHKQLQITDVDSPREFALLRKKESNTSSGTVVLAGIKNFDFFGLSSLKYTIDEIEGIRALRDPSVVQLLAEEEATKERILPLLTAASVVHIATHGFVAKSSERSGEQPRESMTVNTRFRSGDNTRFVAVAGNPLLNCGLLFARPTVSKSKMLADKSVSIMTAQEVAELRFKNCDLVTLSACQTGLGEGLNGQGIVGLRSAFLAAGANSVLMSLWDVDDASTCQLMKLFYSHMWGGSKNKIDALRAAQKDLCDDESHPEWRNPKYWAGWVITGDGWKDQ